MPYKTHIKLLANHINMCKTTFNFSCSNYESVFKVFDNCSNYKQTKNLISLIKMRKIVIFKKHKEKLSWLLNEF